MSDQLLTIVKYPDPVLRRVASPCPRVTPELVAFSERMMATMHADDGVGLAAPQVGVSLRIIVVDTGEEKPVALFNPEIVTCSGEQTGVEGCLSFPGLHGEVTRADRLAIRGLNTRGRRVTLAGEGFWARAMQHEMDHLDGVMFVDRVLPETLYWATGERDARGNYLTRPAILAEALREFEARYTNGKGTG
jgi:peptide deformylase